jgi:AraC-like DNA-binding protein
LEENRQILDILRQSPDVPFSIERLAEMLGKSHAQIEDALEDLEGPIPSEGPAAFVHYWRLTDEAIYLP